MIRFFSALMLCAVISTFSTTLLAQSTMPPPPYGDFPAHLGPGLDDLPTRRAGPVVKREPRVIKQGLLAPSAGDRAAFATFLKGDNTGLIRLLPRAAYESEVYPVDKKLNILGGGAYYSFTTLTHVYGYGSDIGLDRNTLSVGFAGIDYGMLTNIGDVPLEQVTLDDIRTQAIGAYLPSRSEPAGRNEYRQLNSDEGIAFDGFVYKKRAPVQENSTYLLRSIAYYTSDVLVAFRLVRKDTNGSVIIAWKLLKRYAVPKLTRKG